MMIIVLDPDVFFFERGGQFSVGELDKVDVFLGMFGVRGEVDNDNDKLGHLRERIIIINYKSYKVITIGRRYTIYERASYVT